MLLAALRPGRSAKQPSARQAPGQPPPAQVGCGTAVHGHGTVFTAAAQAVRSNAAGLEWLHGHCRCVVTARSQTAPAPRKRGWLREGPNHFSPNSPNSPTFFKLLQTSPDLSKLLQTSPNVSKFLQTSPIFLRTLENGRNDLRAFL
jgi:hypothetical protein